ncbi:RnfABCDGE type electron transport complex subunit D [Natroniella sulfidigena]|uniref:RnfABCDGE type electron transport complex subunit D n=1 Tax=Natroniella sulfidigena TaxID=723921 RepID=UPI00200A3E07|nr:RnfABCDGE type electron transport complex subunit D [Natroniella sulfidigena]MCK8816154.1 RnfABCDGE type electron transport complex subunit D [Natroniella sulfidigena]
MKTKLLVEDGPHLHQGLSVSDAMWDVIIALVPVTLTSLVIFGFESVMIIVSCVLGALLGEAVVRKKKGEEARFSDGSAMVTGLILALTLPPTAWWMAIPSYFMGGFVATAVFRELMGGLGNNPLNPAVASRIFLLMARMSSVYVAQPLVEINEAFAPYLYDIGSLDAFSKATPLMVMGGKVEEAMPSTLNLFLLNEGGSLGETSVLAVIIGLFYLVYKGHIKLHIPVAAVSTVFVLAALFGQNPIHHVLSGGLIFGAAFMATDWVTSPVTDKGRIIFGIGIGALVALFRILFFVQELWVGVGGVAFAILIMNLLVPTIDRMTARTAYGKNE